MNLKKIAVVWAASWHTFLSVPLTSWVGILALLIQRFYRGLGSLSAIGIVAGVGIAGFFTVNYLLVLIWLSCIVYLMRPSVGLKNNDYIQEYFSSENLACLVSLMLFFMMLSLMVPLWMRGGITGFALVTYSFLYDYKNSLPERFCNTLYKSFLFIIYKAPFFLALVILLSIFEYWLINGAAFVGMLMVVYPAMIALITLLYIQGIHEQYELYYAE